MRFFYTLAARMLAPIFCAVLLWRGWQERGYWHDFKERFGFAECIGASSIWVHAVSVGEVQAAASLIRVFQHQYPNIPLVITTVTPAGRARARSLFGDAVRVRYVPLDLPGCVRRFFDRAKPRVAVIFETELWPNLYRECGLRRIPLVLASARISPRSVRRYRRMAGLFKETLSRDILIAAQGEADAERFRSIGANPDRTFVTGNVKFDLALPADVHLRGRALRERHAAGRKIWIAGSTHEGEEQMVLTAHRHVQRTHPDALLVLVPRHPSRFADVAAWLTREGVSFVRHSQGTASQPATEVLLVDTLGELLNFYAASDVAFVGGSLAPIGGHNLLEPAALGLPVLTGPHNFNSEDVTRLLVERGGAEIVRDGQDLGRKVAALFDDPQARTRIGVHARNSVEANRGALNNLLNLIAPLISHGVGAGSGAGAGAGAVSASH